MQSRIRSKNIRAGGSLYIFNKVSTGQVICCQDPIGRIHSQYFYYQYGDLINMPFEISTSVYFKSNGCIHHSNKQVQTYNQRFVNSISEVEAYGGLTCTSESDRDSLE